MIIMYKYFVACHIGSVQLAVRQLQPKVAQIRAHNNLPTRH